MEGFPILSFLTFSPILASALLFYFRSKSTGQTIKVWALFITTVHLGLSIYATIAFDPLYSGMQFVEQMSWIPSIGVQYMLGVDGISLPFIVLSSLITWLTVILSWQQGGPRLKEYFISFLMMEGFMVGMFASLDVVLFYLFWEVMLIPMFLLIGVFGGENRIYAALKFFLYTFVGSVLMLVAFAYIYSKLSMTGQASFAISDFQDVRLGFREQSFLFWAMILAFAVKIPMWPVHTWLPNAHVEAPTGGSVVLAAVMLKMGGYGMLRFILPVLPDASVHFASIMVFLSLIAIVYIGLVALVQKDMKKLIAYSSIAHMGFVTLGLFACLDSLYADNGIEQALLGMQGAMVQMLSHGLISGALFACVGILYSRRKSRLIANYGGVLAVLPVFGAFFVFFCLANAGLPGTSGFIGEFFIILASFAHSPWTAAIAATTLILGASYSLWMVKRVIYGAVNSDKVAQLSPLHWNELMVLWILGFLVLLLGIYPTPLIHLMDGSITTVIHQAMFSKIF